MKLVDADLLQVVIRQLKEKYLKKDTSTKERLEYFETEFEMYKEVLDRLQACTCPTYTVIETESSGWILCSERLPEKGVNVILTFRDTFHTHPSWPKVQVMVAWICNCGDEHPDGEWAIEGRLGNYVVNLEDGIAWQPLPKPYQE